MSISVNFFYEHTSNIRYYYMQLFNVGKFWSALFTNSVI
jgi:hypothetical protein